MNQTEVVKKSTRNAVTGFDLEKLTVSVPGLIPCSFEEGLEEITVTYEMEGLKNSESIQEEDRAKQLQFLMNLASLRSVLAGYDCSLKTENIYYDENYLPCLKDRDLYSSSNQYSEEKFLENYRILVGGILSKKYTVNQLMDSGIEMLSSEPAFEPYLKVTSVDEMVQLLREKKEQYIAKEQATKQTVSKVKYITLSILGYGCSVLALVLAGFLIYAHVWVIPREEHLIRANQCFIQSDYVGCTNAMVGIATEDMAIETKYILAVSYAKCESLKKEEMDTIISKLSVVSNPKELDYWIQLGRANYAGAIDLAQALSNDQLLVYAYMKELDSLETNTTISGEEKQSRIEELQQKITQLGDKYKPEEEK